MLTRKHFKLLADAFKETKPTEHAGEDFWIQWEKDVEAIASALKQTNPNFDKQRFMEASGVRLATEP